MIHLLYNIKKTKFKKMVGFEFQVRVSINTIRFSVWIYISKWLKIDNL